MGPAHNEVRAELSLNSELPTLQNQTQDPSELGSLYVFLDTHLADEETKAQRGQMTYLGWEVGAWSWGSTVPRTSMSWCHIPAALTRKE